MSGVTRGSLALGGRLLIWAGLALPALSLPEPASVEVVLRPPEATFQVRRVDGRPVPGGPDPRSRLNSGSVFLNEEPDNPEPLWIESRHQGYADYRQQVSLRKRGRYWSPARQGWHIEVELSPRPGLPWLRHQLRFYPTRSLLAGSGLCFTLALGWYLLRRRPASSEVPPVIENPPSRGVQDTDLSGRQIDDYLVISQLGEGGFARVYRVRHVPSGESFALKILRTQRGDIEAFQRLQRESQIGRRWQHPNLVAIHAFGEYQGTPYLVMDLLEGEELTRVLERGRVERAQALSWFRDLCEGVAHAHSLGILHRDLKPDNLFVTQGGSLKILDFGVARAMFEESDLTQTGQSLGTPSYMAPEQLLGTPDLRSDIYALGVLLYLLLAGRLPFAHKDASEVLSAHLTERPPGLSLFVPDIDPDLERLCMRMLEKSPTRRVGSVTEVLAALDGLDWGDR